MSRSTTADASMPAYEIRRPRIDREEFERNVLASPHGQNVGKTERLVGGAAGAALLALAFSRKSLLNKILLAGLGGTLLYRSLTGRCPVYNALGLSTAQQHPARPEDYFQRGIHVEASQVINAPPEKLYRFWREFSNLPHIMSHLKSVQTLSGTRSRWTAAAPLHTSLFWEAEIIHDVPNELIAWSSVENSDIENAGTVLFTPRDDHQTEVRVVLDYIPPAGKIGKLLAQFLGHSPEKTIAEDFHRFKLLMEACE